MSMPHRRKVHEIAAGTLVQRDPDGPYFMTAEREGKEYVHHYLVRLHPRPASEAETTVVYLDPEEDLLDHGAPPPLDMGPVAGAARPACGDLFANAHGTFFMVRDTPRSQKHFAFVNTSSGMFSRREDRAVERVHADWALDLSGL